MPNPTKSKSTRHGAPAATKNSESDGRGATRTDAYSAPSPYKLLDSNVSPQHVMLKIADLMQRYGCGKTTACDRVNEPDFPGEVAPRCWRLDHVLMYEDARAWAGRGRPDSVVAASADDVISATDHAVKSLGVKASV